MPGDSAEGIGECVMRRMAAMIGKDVLAELAGWRYSAGGRSTEETCGIAAS